MTALKEVHTLHTTIADTKIKLTESMDIAALDSPHHSSVSKTLIEVHALILCLATSRCNTLIA